jgi:NADPH:quinone reductase-like Zn-dependent oxidoreductase
MVILVLLRRLVAIGAGGVDLVRSLGADQVIDYTQADFADGTEHYDVIVDIGGNSPLSRLRRALTHKGILVIVGGEGGGKLTEFIESGTVTPSVGGTYPLDQAADVMRQLVAGAVHGKIAITI